MNDASFAGRRSFSWIIPALASLCFACLSLAILKYPGLQEDEILFTAPMYMPALFRLKVWGVTVPLMLMGYLGTLKTWLYSAILEVFPPSRWAVRVPVVVAGVITIGLTWMWVRRVAGSRAAAFAVALLSTDAVFIMTNTFDWGPVALQHVFLMGGLLAVQIWIDGQASSGGGPHWFLAAGFFLWGLGLWDKALMIWPLTGLAIAAVCVYPRELRRHLKRVPLMIAAGSLLLGALPLVGYNLARHGETASAYAKFAADQLPRKLHELEYTLDGSVLLGPIVATTPGLIAQTPATLVERLSVAVQRRFGEHARNLMLPAIALSLLCMVLQFRATQFRILIFVLIAMTVAWLQMAMNAGTGGGAHHVILLWPFPCIFVGISLATAAERAPKIIGRAVFAVAALLVCGNVLNTNEYLADLILNGAVGGWTDAFYRLTGAVYPYRSGRIGIVDWGYQNGLHLISDGELKTAEVTDKDAIDWNAMVLVQHTDDNQLYSGVNDKLSSAAMAHGYTEQVIRTVHDNQGRPVFEIFRFGAAGNQPAR